MSQNASVRRGGHYKQFEYCNDIFTRQAGLICFADHACGGSVAASVATICTCDSTGEEGGSQHRYDWAVAPLPSGFCWQL